MKKAWNTSFPTVPMGLNFWFPQKISPFGRKKTSHFFCPSGEKTPQKCDRGDRYDGNIIIVEAGERAQRDFFLSISGVI